MRSCKFYTPMKNESENHEGIEPSDHYDFDQLPLYTSSCKCPSRLANSSVPIRACDYPLDQVECSDYIAEEDHLVRKAQIHSGGKTQILELTMTRLRFAIAEYHVTLVTTESNKFEELLHRVNAHEHGIEEALSMANELFEYELLNQREQTNKSVAEIKIKKKSESSYLSKVRTSL